MCSTSQDGPRSHRSVHAFHLLTASQTALGLPLPTRSHPSFIPAKLPGEHQSTAPILSIRRQLLPLYQASLHTIPVMTPGTATLYMAARLSTQQAGPIPGDHLAPVTGQEVSTRPKPGQGAPLQVFPGWKHKGSSPSSELQTAMCRSGGSPISCHTEQRSKESWCEE